MEIELFYGANVFLSRDLVPPELFHAVHNALKLNAANVFLHCDPSRNAPNDYHVISSSDHEMFEDLQSKGCNLIGPQCVLSCAEEQKMLPNKPFTCCLAMDGVTILASGFKTDENANIAKMVTAMGGVLQTEESSDVSFVIVKNVLARRYKWALNNLRKPIVTLNWLVQCWKEHCVVPQDSYRVLAFSGLIISFTGIHKCRQETIERLVVRNGGKYSAELTKRCTHLVCEAAKGNKYKAARIWGHIHIISMKWFYRSISRRACLNEESYPFEESSASSRKIVKRNATEMVQEKPLTKEVKDSLDDQQHSDPRFHTTVEWLPFAEGMIPITLVDSTLPNERVEEMSNAGALDLASRLGGKIDKSDVLSAFDKYQKDEVCREEKERKADYTSMAKRYCDLVIGFYNYGPGEPFHDTPNWNGKSSHECIKWRISFLALKLGLKPGQKVLDVGCQMNGPLGEMEHRIALQESYMVLPFSGFIICISGIPKGALKAMEKLVIINGGKYSHELTMRCTHLVCEAAKGEKYKAARTWGHIHIVSKKWFFQSVTRRARLSEESYPVQGNSTSSLNTLNTKAIELDREKNSANISSTFPGAPSLTKEGNNSLADQQIIDPRFRKTVELRPLAAGMAAVTLVDSVLPNQR